MLNIYEYLPVQEKYTPQILPLIMEKSYLYHIYEANQNHNTSLISFYSYTNGVINIQPNSIKIFVHNRKYS